MPSPLVKVTYSFKLKKDVTKFEIRMKIVEVNDQKILTIDRRYIQDQRRI